MREGDAGRILVVDNDRDIADIVQAILADSGFAVRVVTDYDSARIHQTVEQFGPDCVLLDGQGPGNYGESWLNAAWLFARDVPTVMFTADAPAAYEAEHQFTSRSRNAHFAAVLTKPFDIDELIGTVSSVIRQGASS